MSARVKVPSPAPRSAHVPPGRSTAPRISSIASESFKDRTQAGERDRASLEARRRLAPRCSLASSPRLAHEPSQLQRPVLSIESDPHARVHAVLEVAAMAPALHPTFKHLAAGARTQREVLGGRPVANAGPASVVVWILAVGIRSLDEVSRAQAPD